ncbi:MAG TPA: hypothetical protein VI461_14280 [Chitinophagaceae bacterium]|nr:hypothetical protein [Chitinophagaceae bacterium]
MKKILPLVFVFIVTGIAVQAQTPQALKKVMELKMPKTVDDDMPGTRGAGVVWHPVQKKYYASFAGNMAYPMAVFDIKGKRLSGDTITAMIDTRGLWYNPVTKLICGNAYSDLGWFSYKLSNTGIPSDYEVLFEEMNQPTDQSVGTYNPIAKQVLFLDNSQVIMYNSDGEKQDSVAIHWGRKKADGPGEDEDIYTQHEDYNITSVLYTGIKGQELGFLNITNKQIELYDIKSGFLSKVLTLPETATTEDLFNFAFANGTYWLFNIELRKWVGYK